MITQEQLKSVLNYNHETGLFTWIKSRTGIRYKNPTAGWTEKNGYVRIHIDGKSYLAHRLAYLYTMGRWPKQIDHINGIRNDNRWRNIRNTSSRANNMNRSIGKANTSGAIGVCWHKGSQTWHASIRVNNKLIHIGSFKLKDDAIAARKEAEHYHGFHPNHGRQPDRHYPR